MSLYQKSLGYLYESALKKNLPNKSSLYKKLEKVGVSELDNMLDEFTMMEHMIEALGTEELFKFGFRQGRDSLDYKVALLKKKLPIVQMEFFSVEYDKNLVSKVDYSGSKWHSTQNLVLEDSWIHEIVKLKDLSPLEKNLSRSILKATLGEEKLPGELYVFQFSEIKSILFYLQNSFFNKISSRLMNIYLSIIKRSVKEDLANSLNVDTKVRTTLKDQQLLYAGLKHYFSYEQKRRYMGLFEDIIEAFGLRAVVLLERLSSTSSYFRVSDWYGTTHDINIKASFSIVDLIAAKGDERLTSLLFPDQSYYPFHMLISDAFLLNYSKNACILLQSPTEIKKRKNNPLTIETFTDDDHQALKALLEFHWFGKSA